MLKDNDTGVISYIMKLRGVVMNSAASEKINFQTFYDLVMEKNTEPILTERMILKRKYTSIQTVPEKKIYLSTNEKGYKFTDDRIYPFGYEQQSDR